jgi:hypothetical protein
MATLKVVAHYQDGRLVKGITNNFALNDPTLLIIPVDGEDQPTGDRPTQVAVADLKAAFLVESLQGNPGRKDIRSFEKTPPVYGRKLTITFKDGETLCGVSPTYDPSRPVFMLTPADPESNNLRMIVVNQAVTNVQSS